MNKAGEIRKSILEMARRYYGTQFRSRPFSPGKDKITYAGRIFDQDELVDLIDSALDFWLTSGRFAREFEERFSGLHDAKYCCLTNSGSSANLLAIAALTSPKLGSRRLQPGDEVITVAAGFPTTVAPIVQYQLVPVFVDIELGTYNISIPDIEKAISPRTKAIFIAHTLGNPFDVDAIVSLKNKHGLWLIEDCCDALGAKYRHRPVGTFGDISTFSFYPAHHITMGEGGALLTNDPHLYNNIRSFRDWGRDCWCEPGNNNTCGKRFVNAYQSLPEGYDHKYVYSHLGYNLKITDMQAAVGVAQLKKLKRFIVARNTNFKKYLEFFSRYQDFFILPAPLSCADPSWFGFLLTLKSGTPFTRKDFVRYLDDQRIDTRMLFAGNMIRQPAFAGVRYRQIGELACTEKVMNDAFWFGVYPGLDEARLDFIFERSAAFFSKVKR